MHCFWKSLTVIRRYHHFTHRAANHCCQSLKLPTTHVVYIKGHFFKTLVNIQNISQRIVLVCGKL